MQVRKACDALSVWGNEVCLSRSGDRSRLWMRLEAEVEMPLSPLVTPLSSVRAGRTELSIGKRWPGRSTI